MKAILDTYPPMSVEEYLASEEASPVKREYVAGRVYAMAGASVRHNQIALNLAVTLHSQVRGGPCQVLFADVKLHIPYHREDLFYYPDLMVCCDPTDSHSHYRERPCLVVEVLSESTRSIDTREKFIAYTQIASLEGYLILDQDRIEATLRRRETGWQKESYEGPEARLSLPCGGGLEIGLGEVYGGVEWGESGAG
ncbi:Uma2 family endonuclease [Candidatus Methylocalor cossyra]|uniref:Uma2 family endonuclease n=1 Tax=Candidatus Methylocalor cossyra TaxID=3108543 RepID=A0ABM9NKB1_9GAMM